MHCQLHVYCLTLRASPLFLHPPGKSQKARLAALARFKSEQVGTGGVLPLR